MQAGFTYRPIIARRDGAQTEARSVMGEFVSGNYFRTFGIRPQAGRLLMDSDDVQGAAPTAVMSYQTWQSQFAGESAVIGSTFWVNTKPVTVVGIAPRGFYGYRLTSTPPDFYLPIETMPALANVPYVHDPETNWLYIVGRVKPGIAPGSLQEKVNAVVRQAFGVQKLFTTEQGKKALPKVHVVLTPGGAGIQTLQEDYASHLHLLMTSSDCAARISRTCCWCGVWDDDGDVGAIGSGSDAVADHSPVKRRRVSCLRVWAALLAPCGVRGDSHAAVAGVSGFNECAYRGKSSTGSGRVCFCDFNGHGRFVRRGAGVDRGASRSPADAR